MKVITESINFSTKGFSDIKDITSMINNKIKDSKLRKGIVTVFVPGSTGGLTTMEYEPGLIKDLKNLLDKIIPSNIPYFHDETWGDGNGFSHLRASLIGPSLTVPFSDGRLLLGTWQQIIFIDFDNRPRSRNLIVQLIGEE
ncbi:secondary thiamine-phosphate synthase enzyme YjbQ [SCandidatus Aminicenantes bacterium Aminicenantia_JdfR_composite]|jgi:secondary thiamine-phosphate synthase enzyme|nr:secondary thiamine-phosphate synthase enzyme YjbQ [SCandidatus Aminicenantes bacterium Aminicenantia_JdfR_composite]MCP2597229.1 secondary thiamine-phosphate synthase enzyme YjbQ [Candidatus Aminicenantes bacterium AC-335-G13]MCP2597727.1 secondary thiamine-phosphate synthase enzyme YjbQ [Candidatus Aminicenantes bacterium AC-335-L06]MCP2620894.1 secondary thiamine-phosphate synthase enzyme YjbQ [Candidatus Aminicenantes bacterium AC-334-E05]